MTKSIKRFAVSFCAVLLVFTTLCTSAFAAGTINANVTGNYGYKKISYSYTVDHILSRASVGFVTTGENSSYILTFSPASGSSATIYFCEWGTDYILDSLTVPKSGSGMPSSFIASVDLGKNKFVSVYIQSDDPTSNASGWFTIEGLLCEGYLS